LARELEKQFQDELQTKPTNNTVNDFDDEEFARQLQLQYSQQNSNQSYQTNTPIHSTERKKVSLNIKSFDPKILTELLSTLKQPLVEGMKQLVTQNEVPEIEDTLDLGGAVGKVEIGISSISIKEVELDSKDIDLTVEDNILSFSLKKFSVEFRESEWFYKKLTFPKLEDTGKFSMKIEDAEIKTKVEISSSAELETKSCDVTIKNIDIKILGTKKKCNLFNFNFNF